MGISKSSSHSTGHNVLQNVLKCCLISALYPMYFEFNDQLTEHLLNVFTYLFHECLIKLVNEI